MTICHDRSHLTLSLTWLDSSWERPRGSSLIFAKGGAGNTWLMSTRGPPNLCPGAVNPVSGVACGVGCENSLAPKTESKTRFWRVLERGFVIVVGSYGLDS